MHPTQIKKAVIPVAGLGTRFLPATKSIPKEMFPIVDKPSIQYIVEEALASGIEQIIFITAHGKEALENHFDTNIELETVLRERQNEKLLKEIRHISRMADIVSIRQKAPLGLGHAILCAKDMIGNEPFAVLLGDDLVDHEIPCLAQLIEIYHHHHKPVIALMEISKDQSHLYGMVDIACRKDNSRLFDLHGFVEKPTAALAPSHFAIIGRYILPADIFASLTNTQAGAGNEIHLTDALQHLLHQQPMLGYRYRGKRLDVGDKLGFIHANLYYGLKRPELAEHLKSLIKGLE